MASAKAVFRVTTRLLLMARWMAASSPMSHTRRLALVTAV